MCSFLRTTLEFCIGTVRNYTDDRCYKELAIDVYLISRNATVKFARACSIPSHVAQSYDHFHTLVCSARRFYVFANSPWKIARSPHRMTRLGAVA